MDTSTLLSKGLSTLAEGEAVERVTYNFFAPGSELWSLSLLIPLIPYIAAFVILYIGYKRQDERLNHLLSIGANVIAWGVAMLLFIAQLLTFSAEGHMKTIEVVFFEWFKAGTGAQAWTVKVGFLIDPLSTVMFTLVATLALLIQIYGYKYMHGEKGVISGRYNAEISLFVGSMLLLSLSMNHLLFFIGWELMGLCSYLLIGYFIEKDVEGEDGAVTNPPGSAAKKAFMITKLGDVMLMAGFALLFYYMTYGAKTFVSDPLNFIEIRNHLDNIPTDMQPVIALLLFGGAVGKSAQFPLHIWLPEAMEGPTTVSALIHSATMVKAGVFLVARNYYLFEGTWVLPFVGFVGSFTAIFAASMAFVADDIKRVLAFSTISQLGYMFLGLGAGSLTGGMYHLISHSFFKCLLFLAAGSIIHAVHSNNMWDMGGLRQKMPKTFIAMTAGALGLAGIIPFNGFFSKDAVILASVVKYENTGDIVYLFMGIAGLLTALMTGFYITRMMVTVFAGGETRKEGAHPQESPEGMTYPLLVLGGIVLVSGLLSLEGFFANLLAVVGVKLEPLLYLNLFNEHVLHHLFAGWVLLEGTEPHIPEGTELIYYLILPLTALGLAVIGVVLAYFMYHPAGRLYGTPKRFNESRPVAAYAQVLKQRYYINHFYLGMATFFREGVAEVFRLIDTGVDLLVDGVGRKTAQYCEYAVMVDDGIIDGTVRVLSSTSFKLGDWVRHRQTGVLLNYTQYIVVGLIVLIAALLGAFVFGPIFL